MQRADRAAPVRAARRRQQPLPGPDRQAAALRAHRAAAAPAYPGPVEAVPLSELARTYRKAPPHGFAFPALTSVSEATTADVPTLTASALLAEQAGVDLSEVIKALQDGSGNTDYEELECLGLDEGLQSLVAAFKIKPPSGYSGQPCTAGSKARWSARSRSGSRAFSGSWL